MHDANKGMGRFLGYMRKIGHLSVMEDMESSNEGSLTSWLVEFNFGE
jgi:hypothetical protein